MISPGVVGSRTQDVNRRGCGQLFQGSAGLEGDETGHPESSVTLTSHVPNEVLGIKTCLVVQRGCKGSNLLLRLLDNATGVLFELHFAHHATGTETATMLGTRASLAGPGRWSPSGLPRSDLTQIHTALWAAWVNLVVPNGLRFPHQKVS